ncbi:MAG: hypothetical protein H6719_38520, partial [Sandaracinaceae bacterium]|nr:hypothetical protein [Sandaracinaceae bacterium]
MAAPSDDDHELLRAFDAIGCPLNRTLQEMLNEHAKHCTERRGCGYTQATRHVAKHLNNVRKPLEYDEITLFLDRDSSVLRALLDGAAAQGVPFTWRNLDRRPPPVAMRDDPAWCALYEREAARQAG